MTRFLGKLSLIALVAVPLLTFAATPVPPKTLGTLEATLNFCARVDSKSADKYKEWGKMLVRDISAKDLAEARDSSEYKETYDANTAELEKVSKDKAMEACRDFPGGSKK